MTRTLKDILAMQPKTVVSPIKKIEGVATSYQKDLTTGNDPGVDYAAKAKNDREFVKQHTVQVHADRNGNGDEVFKGSGVKYALQNKENMRMGRTNKAAASVYESVDDKVKAALGSRYIGDSE